MPVFPVAHHIPNLINELEDFLGWTDSYILCERWTTPPTLSGRSSAIVGSYICMTWSVLYKQMEPWAHILSISTNFQVSSKHGVCSDSLLISQKGPDFPPPTRTCCGFTRAVERQWLYLMVIYWSKIQAAVMRLRLVFVSSCSQRSNLALPHWMDSNTLILLSTVQ